MVVMQETMLIIIIVPCLKRSSDYSRSVLKAIVALLSIKIADFATIVRDSAFALH
jgi:hypothetical protein